MALRRIKKELQDISRDPSSCGNASPFGLDMFYWKGTVLGPPDTPYETGVFDVDIILPPCYPFEPPHIVFKTRIYHPNITPRGSINLQTCQNGWKINYTIKKVLSDICDLMANPITDYDVEVPDIARQYRTDRAAFERTAREWTQRYAT